MRLRFQLIIFMFLRTILNSAHRMVYPFLPIFARGLGVDIATMSLLMTARSLLGATSPLLGPIADRRGRKFGMLTGLGIFTLGIGIVAVFPTFWALAVALSFAMVGKFMFDPAMQAYFGDRIPYNQRGTALAVTEVAWSLGFIVGVPVAGFLIDRFGWSAPFPLFTILGAGRLLHHLAHRSSGRPSPRTGGKLTGGLPRRVQVNARAGGDFDCAVGKRRE
ncbi:MAG: MFS transporter [Chloroflexi bacterium]|nr:MFS transporter [Chloroflexota bacterium]